MADEIIIETTSQEVITIGVPGPQGPAGAAGTGLETLTTKGDTLYRGNTTGERLPIGATGQILRVSASGIPEWGAAPASGVFSVNGETGAVTLDGSEIDTSGNDDLAAFVTYEFADGNGLYYPLPDTTIGNKRVYRTTTGHHVFFESLRWHITDGSPITANIIESSDDDNAAWPWLSAWDGSIEKAQLSTVVGRARSTFLFVGDSIPNTSVSGLATVAASGDYDDLAGKPAIPSASTATPSALGTAAAGTSSNFARADHVHAMPTANDVGALSNTADLNDLADAESARINLGLGTAATLNVGTTAGTVAAGDDARLTNSRSPNAHAASHAAGGSDPVTLQLTQVVAPSGGLGPLGDGETLNDYFSTAGNIVFSNTEDFAAASHTHAAADITSGTLDIARIPTGTSSTQVALGNHSHELTALAATGASNGTVLTANGSGGVTFAAASGGGVNTGSVDNAVLRANGTGGSTSQSSDLVIDDAVVAYAITGDASTDIITAVGHNYTANQAVRFQVLAGGSGLNNTTTYFVRDISGNTFKVSTSSGGAAVNFTTNITSGSIVATQPSVAIHTQRAIFTITADASTDVITATAHTFVDGDSVTFSNLVGGAGLDTITRYFVRDISGDTFKVSTTAGGSATNITTNYTGGTVELDVALVIGGNRLGAVIVGSKPDLTTLGGNARGSGAVDLQQVRAAATQVASGTSAFLAGGRSNTASGLDSVVLGGNVNTASAYVSAVLGSVGSSATGQGGVVIAGANASATNAEGCLAIGSRALADRAQIIAQGAGQFGATGDAQRIHAVLRGKTTSNTAVELLTATNTNQRLTIPSGKVMAGIINCVGVKSDGAAVAHYVREFSAKNVAGTSSLVGSVTTIGADTEDNASTDISVTVSDANDALTISVTGIASETWRWVASVDAVEVAYGT